MLLFCFVWVLSCRGLRTLLEADYHTLPWKRRSLCSRLALSPCSGMFCLGLVTIYR